MTYSASELESSFKKVARSRKGNKKYDNDAQYWEGGRCNWGGSHNLQEDCQTFADGFNKVSGLKDIKSELQKCTSKSEYDQKKNNYIRQCDEALTGLNTNTRSAYAFGVCCIWSDVDPKKTVESKIKVVCQDLQNIKSTLQKEDYKWVQELKDLELEINQITQRMEENKRKAMNETDSIKKAALIAQIDEDGLLLQQKYQKKKELSNKFNFDPKKKVDDLIKAMKKAIERNNKKPRGSGGGGGSGRNRNPNNSESESSDSDDESSDDDDSNHHRKKDQPSLFQNQQLILIAGVAVLILFFLWPAQKEVNKPTYDFDF
ncbi:MAG: hypothetical protein I3274_02805 [Candidatus Moeniiplasma glomeromycotorum]|nr:hypothetical protein [Candidatus Moeniiplasma glomeromycotorum]MCE8167535.1 hypothetical protein [Candidatus Moeniiplasma glomeromycotorum]